MARTGKQRTAQDAREERRQRRVGAEIARRREAKGLTAYALARAAGVEPVVVRYTEAGERDPRLSTLDALAAALGTTAGKILEAAEE